MNHNITIKKGLDLRLEGAVADAMPRRKVKPALVAIVPDDYPGFTPKVEVKEGDVVATGQPLFFDKRDPDVKLVSPVAGTVKAIVRGERRKLERIVVEPSDEKATSGNPALAPDADADTISTFLKRNGLWALMRQRPYDIVPMSGSVPRDIFVTAVDSAPLAADFTPFFANETEKLAAAVKLLGKLTSGKVYIARRPGSKLPDIAGAEMINVSGPHPAGNVGVQIANIAPVNKGETVWTMDITALWRIGSTALEGIIPATTFVALTGSEIQNPEVVETLVGCDIQSLLEGKVADNGRHKRIISGNVLTGIKVDTDGFLRFPYRQVTVIPEGDDVDEFMGWASLSPKKMSESRTFFGKLFGKRFAPDARLNGGHRAFIMSGEYDRYMPMDIMPEYLLKAIMGRDIEKMEQLGIYEVAPEDFALGEYADTSKLEAQKTVREGLDYIRKELE